MLTTKERRPAIRTWRGWAIAALSEAHAIQEYEEHGWMPDRADPHARQRAFAIARLDPPSGVSPRPPPSQSQKWLDLDRRHLSGEPSSGLRALIRMQLAFD